MVSHSTLSESLYGEGLKTIAYILNKMLTNIVAITPFELLIGKKPSLRYFHV